jgi:hypothetical protein
MKTQITIVVVAVMAVIVGGLSMGCIDAPVEVIEVPEVVEVVEVVEVLLVVEVIEITPSEVEVITYKVYPVINYCECTVEYPDNVAGFDTPKERAYIYQSMLDDKMDTLYDEGIAQQRYQSWGDKSYTEFYHGLYQDKQDSYQKLYCGLGNKIMTDGDSLVTRDVGAFNFTSPWGPRNLGNGSVVFDLYTGKVNFIGSVDIASGEYMGLTGNSTVISNMFYTYMGNNATLPGETEITF